MRLRSHIRRPKRLVDEIQGGTADAARSLHQPTSSPRPAVIEFNPNLPAAAFPTLKTPRPAASDENGTYVDSSRPAATRHDEGQVVIENIQGNGTGNRARTANHGIGDDLADIPMESLDNYAASNGDQNPIYHRNMTMMASCIDERGKPLVVSDSEDERDRSSSSSATLEMNSCKAPEWSDLIPQLQVEIVENLRQTYKWSDIFRMLGLTDTQIGDLQKHWGRRTRQIELENGQLQIMRTKQLRRLLRIDNSQRRMSVAQPELGFRTVSMQHARILNEKVRRNYLLSRSHEVSTARRFLERLGLDKAYAGLWSNITVTVPTVGDNELMDADEPVLLDDGFFGSEAASSAGDADEESASESEEDDVMDVDNLFDTVDVQRRVSTWQRKQSYINGIGLAGTVSPRDLRRRVGQNSRHLAQTTPLHHRPVSQPSHTHGLVRLKIGSHRAAQIRDRNQEPCVDPRDVYAETPSKGRLRPSVPGQSSIPDDDQHLEPSGQSPTRRLVFTTSRHNPLERTMGGFWSYGSVDNLSRGDTGSVQISSSFKLSQTLEAARAEARTRQHQTLALPGHAIPPALAATYSTHDARFALARSSSYQSALQRRRSSTQERVSMSSHTHPSDELLTSSDLTMYGSDIDAGQTPLTRYESSCSPRASRQNPYI